ncbi:hypothetical protein G3O08_09820 [Cryomorpha ignava]|uniref:Bacteriocin n=1 Tax=Cryomorpha ignava TaxID=101383 RepID=A0A7K3WQN0_9FLAO|nr:class I lanthipeptide [Cryomorpha ignava]NEN23798.1 hypothetical protein [Cryomorpha ignava]
MKKIKLNGRLSLNKETIATLNENQMNAVKGGAPGFLSIGEFCSRTATGCKSNEISRPLFCKGDNPGG